MIQQGLAERGFTQAERESLEIGDAVIGKLIDLETKQPVDFTICLPQEHGCGCVCEYCGRNEGALFSMTFGEGICDFICIDCLDESTWYGWREG